MRVVRNTPWRLELSHRPGLLLATAGLAGVGYAVYLFLVASGWVAYVGAVVCLLGSLAVALMASNSYVILDRSAGVLVARHRYLFFGARYQMVLLDEVVAVVINTDSMMGSVLAVICVRVGGTDLPITMFGSPFPAAVHHNATRIARFLDVPLLDKDRMTLKSPEDQLQDLFGRAVSKAAFDPRKQPAPKEDRF
jgi:hypothetical protein